MSHQTAPQYFIIKHGLDALEANPGYIWNDERGSGKKPKGYNLLKKGDRWIAFAYANNDKRERRLSLITGFYECTREARYGPLSRKAQERSGSKKAWMIRGKLYVDNRHSTKLPNPVGVPSIPQLLKERHQNHDPMPYSTDTISKISPKEFHNIREYVYGHLLSSPDIPLLRREPTNEQELLAIVAAHHKQLGIKEFTRIQNSFPDLKVRLTGERHDDHLGLELELYSRNFLAHCHNKQCKNRCFQNEPVAVLCWIDDDDWIDYTNKSNTRKVSVKDCVYRIFELRQLIRDGKKIFW